MPAPPPSGGLVQLFVAAVCRRELKHLCPGDFPIVLAMPESEPGRATISPLVVATHVQEVQEDDSPMAAFKQHVFVIHTLLTICVTICVAQVQLVN